MTARRLLALAAPAAALALVVLAAAGPGVARASEQRPTLGELEGEVMCVTCKTTLDMSNSPVAERTRDFIRQRIAAGDTKSEIKQALVAEFGEAVLASPSKKGFSLLAWLLPLAGIVGGAVVLGWLAWRWSRNRGAGDDAAGGPGGGSGLGPELEQRVDEELARFEA